MPIRYRPDGTFEFDTVEEAVSWHRAMQEEEAPSPVEPATVGPTEHRQRDGARLHAGTGTIGTFVRDLRPNGVSVLRALADAYPLRLPTAELAEKSGVDAAALGPIFRHIYIVGRRHGFANEELVERVEGRSQDEPRSSFRVADAWANELTRELSRATGDRDGTA